MLHFESDYVCAAHPRILERIGETNLEGNPGYGKDPHCARAKEKILAACGLSAQEAGVHFLVGGTQTNAIFIKTVLRPYEGVIAAESGHVNGHEAGAIEAGGHKVLTVPGENGKVQARDVDALARSYEKDANREHTVKPGMVYLSHPSEYGTLYSKAELTALRQVCDKHGLLLYLDGARLGYGLVSPGADLALTDIARLCDAFYIGGTKVGALFGEALVISSRVDTTGLFSIIKQSGGLLAKGWLLGLQFDTLFTDGLYLEISKNAIVMAQRLKKALAEKGYQFFLDSPTNQQFVVVENSRVEALKGKVGFDYLTRTDEDHTVIRFATGWSTTGEDLEQLIALL